MPGNHLVPLRLPSALIAHSSRASILPTQSSAATYALRGARLQSVAKEWKGAHTEEHSIPRAKRGDTNDPSADAVASGMEERDVNGGIADDTKSQATTQRGGRKEEKKAKTEHPAAPEPIIGMNDERGGVRKLSQLPAAGILLTCTSIEGPLIAQLVPYHSYYRRYVLLALDI